ncbi:hypothetical protein [Sporosarcina sp. HYO08]|uniref:hypothetical protein n=1 Tax=Sporosarcina sp. HYO08 TaxID=1759557 RepID=UPI000793D7C2|nr:hypothetical protein [Sporosarcina sp. HYO08]KXH78535.1 hypothetical protein AU377_12710 [Sporosarcina sp. HYO08]
MKHIVQSLVNEYVRIEVSGKEKLHGNVIDIGSDIIVIYNGKQFVYIPLGHIQNLIIDRQNENDITPPTEFPSIITGKAFKELSFKEVISQAIGKYIEVFVAGHESLHGQIRCVMDDYFVFDSPVYKTMYVSMNHLKWLIPYAENEKLYDIDQQNPLGQQKYEDLAKSFAKQMNQLKDQLIVVNVGSHKSCIGKVSNVDLQVAELQTTRANSILLNIDHIKTVHQV